MISPVDAVLLLADQTQAVDVIGLVPLPVGLDEHLAQGGVGGSCLDLAYT
ncbi:hypothetical protein ACP3TH_09615 [Desulforudis sp. 1031]